MIGTIRKHQTWLWGVIITVTIISFVIFFNPSNRVGNGRVAANYGSFSGVRINEEEFLHTRSEVYLSQLFINSAWPENNYDPTQDIYQRLFLVRKAQELGIHISPDLVAQNARELVKQRLERLRITSPEMFVEASP
jgi:hypothetical protein